MKIRPLHFLVGALLVSQLAVSGPSILNASYDPTREFFDEYNKLFIQHWKGKTGKTISVNQSHGGSGKQARSVIDGLPADVVTLALAYDIDAIASKGQLLPSNWQQRLPNLSCPFTSIIVFVVRKGNPKKIQAWEDLVKPGITVITPNPKTSGGARWNYLAAWGYALKLGSEESAKKYVDSLFKNVPVLDSGARGATTTFVQRNLGDVLLAWENEAHLILQNSKGGEFELVVPSMSISAEPPVAWVDVIVAKQGTAEVAKEYLEFLYTAEGQEIGARHFFRPFSKEIFAKHKKIFAETKLLQIDTDFGGWAQAQKKHFDDGGIFDQIYSIAR
jgi:sulfate/thiosulfate transport system substrate-binding protein